MISTNCNHTSKIHSFVILILISDFLFSSSDDLNTPNEFGGSVTRVVELGGFVSINLYMITKDSCILSLVAISNPSIDGGERTRRKDPILSN